MDVIQILSAIIKCKNEECEGCPYKGKDACIDWLHEDTYELAEKMLEIKIEH